MIQRDENIVLLGHQGRGKNYLAIAID
ncbi:ATP-binding protein, partial [Escherichia coli]